MLLMAPTVIKASCKGPLDVSLAYLHTAHLQQALTNPLCSHHSHMGIRQLEKCLFFVFCQTAQSLLSNMSVEEMSECGKAPGVSLKGKSVLLFDRMLNVSHK